MLVRRSVTALAALVLLSTAACGSDGEEGSSGSSTAGGETLKGLAVSGDFGEKPTIKIDGLEVEKVESAELIEGDGPEVTKESYVDYRFSIVNIDGEEVAGNYQENEPTQLVVASQPKSIIDAVVGTRIGSRVAIAIPVKDLVGDEGAPQAGLEPDADMVLVFDMIEEGEAPPAPAECKDAGKLTDEPEVVAEGDDVTGLDFSGSPENPPCELQVITLKKGDGPKVKVGDELQADYYGTVWGGEEPFDSSFERGEPATFPLAEGSLIDGWVKGLEGVNVGSRVMLVIPPEQGYGEQGSGDQIPGNSTLVFVIDVLGV
jgi:peptidylprolyl isomerase